MSEQTFEGHINLLEMQARKHKHEIGLIQKENDECIGMVQELKQMLTGKDEIVMQRIRRLNKEMNKLKIQMKLIQKDIQALNEKFTKIAEQEIGDLDKSVQVQENKRIDELSEVVTRIYGLLKDNQGIRPSQATPVKQFGFYDGPTFRDIQKGSKQAHSSSKPGVLVSYCDESKPSGISSLIMEEQEQVEAVIEKEASKELSSDLKQKDDQPIERQEKKPGLCLPFFKLFIDS